MQYGYNSRGSDNEAYEAVKNTKATPAIDKTIARLEYQCRVGDLRYKEVININTGLRLGYVTDALFDAATGRISALIAPCPSRFFGLLGHSDDYYIPWENVKRIGDDIILVDTPEDFRRDRKKYR